VSVAENGEVLYTQESIEGQSHTSLLTLFISGVMQTAGWTYSDLDAIAVSDGPGSYTSLRIGASAAKALSYALQCPLLTLDSLTILCEGVSDTDICKDDIIIPMIDARRMEVYMSVFDGTKIPIEEKKAVILDNDTFHPYKKGTNKIILCGNGAQKYSYHFPSEDIVIHHNATTSAFMSRLAQQKFLKKEFSDTAYFSPFYLKNPNITVSRKKLYD
jgi:tRNA threonylcarbamoyladenosine biosynthesis protein TsaB